MVGHEFANTTDEEGCASHSQQDIDAAAAIRHALHKQRGLEPVHFFCERRPEEKDQKSPSDPLHHG